jgi:hypothetical protein
MKVYVGLISSSDELIKYFNNNKESLIPKPIRTKISSECNFKFDAFNPNKSKAYFNVDKHVLESSRGFDYVICLIEQDLINLCLSINVAALCSIIDPRDVESAQIRNFLTNRLTRIFKIASFTIEKMKDADIEYALRLPRRNFQAQELENLCDLYSLHTSSADFHNTAKSLINSLLKRRKPRRKSNFSTKYFVDDKSRFFVFGKERHEVLPTGEPHQPHCELNGNFRFGRRISNNQHFNVSEGEGDNTSIKGEFLNCHDERIVPAKNRTHLNMFSNDHC